MINILHTISEFEPRSGGASVAMLNTATAQKLRGFDVSILATSRSDEESPNATRLRQEGFNVEVLTNASGRLADHPRLAEATDKAVRKADIVHVHGVWEQSQYLALSVAAKTDTPACLTPHGMLTGWSLSQKKLKKTLYLAARLGKYVKQCQAVHFTTPWERDATAKKFHGQKSAIIPLSVDAQAIKAAASAPAGKRLPEGVPTVAFLGRIYPGKGAEHLVHAWPHLKNKDAKLILIGPEQGPLAETLKAIADESGCADRISFWGPVYPPALFALLGSATLFCLPSDHENFGLAAAEAMASGVATLVSSEVAMGVAASDSGAVAIVPRDPRKLAESIGEWLDQPDQRHVLAQKGQSYALSSLSHGAVGDAWSKLYESLG